MVGRLRREPGWTAIGRKYGAHVVRSARKSSHSSDVPVAEFRHDEAMSVDVPVHKRITEGETPMSHALYQSGSVPAHPSYVYRGRWVCKRRSRI